MITTAKTPSNKNIVICTEIVFDKKNNKPPTKKIINVPCPSKTVNIALNLLNKNTTFT